MARDNETNTLELHIKVNGPNLSAISEKCNIGTLRVPTDPSWPKIPLRRSSNNTDDIIEPPCVVTLTAGTPRKARSIVQTVACQHLKSRLNQKYEATTHVAERLPACFDPRFRRQISREKAEKPDEFCITKNDKQTPELDTHIPQGTKKLEEKSRETSKSVNGYIPPCHDVDNLLSSVAKAAKKTADNPVNEQSILEVKHCTTNNSSQCATNERYDVGNKFFQEQKQETNRPLLLMVDEKKIHELPINTLNMEATCSSAQCYSVQIPVVAYRNVPLQISSMPMQMKEDVKIPSVCQYDSVKDGEIVGNIYGKSINSMYSFKESRNEKYPLDSIQQCNTKSSDDIYTSENKSISKHCDHEHTSGRIRDKEMIDSNVSMNNQNITNETMLGKDRYGNFDALELDDAGDANNGEISYSNLNTAARLKNLVGQSCASDSYITDGCNEKRMSNEGKIANNKTWITHSCVNTRKRRLACRVKDDRDNAAKPSTNVINDKMLEKSMQSLVLSEVCDKDYNKSNKEKESKKEKRGELRINNGKRKTASINLSRKAKSFFQKKSRLAIADSDCTLILPGHRGIKGKRYENKTRSKVSQSLRGRDGISSTNSMLVKYNASKQGRSNSRSLTNLRAGNSLEKPSSIPLETRELLNKSYWEYYWKLKRKIASAKPDNAEERGSNQGHLPESQTLRQCSVLSCMINTALRDSTTADGRRPSSDPNARVESVYKASELSSVFVRKMKRRKMKRTSKRLLGLRAIALLCIAMYIAVIFLPMMYGAYFFDEEYDDENANYIELTFQYVASSFGDALDGIINVLTTILLRPVRFDRKR